MKRKIEQIDFTCDCEVTVGEREVGVSNLEDEELDRILNLKGILILADLGFFSFTPSEKESRGECLGEAGCCVALLASFSVSDLNGISLVGRARSHPSVLGEKEEEEGEGGEEGADRLESNDFVSFFPASRRCS